ncbi:MAG: hypothetical protein ACK4RV_18325 [Caulobacter sp.]
MSVAAAWAAAGVGLLLLAGPALAQDAPASGCAYMVQPPGGQIEMRPAEGLDAIFTDAEIQPPPPPAGARVVGVTCWRADLVPAAFDDRSISTLGVPLYVNAGERQIVLEIHAGRVAYRMVRGQLRRAEIDALGQRLNSFQSRLNGN